MQNRVIRIGLRVLLVVSLLMNAAVLGYVLQLRSIASEAGFEGTRLPREIRREFLEQARGDEALRERIAALGEARRALRAAAEATPYDPERVAGIMEEIRGLTAEVQGASQKVLAEAMADVAARNGRSAP